MLIASGAVAREIPTSLGDLARLAMLARISAIGDASNPDFVIGINSGDPSQPVSGGLNQPGGYAVGSQGTVQCPSSYQSCYTDQGTGAAMGIDGNGNLVDLVTGQVVQVGAATPKGSPTGSGSNTTGAPSGTGTCTGPLCGAGLKLPTCSQIFGSGPYASVFCLHPWLYLALITAGILIAVRKVS